jgi:hypothetical protein
LEFDEMLKKIFLSPFFAPIAFFVLWIAFMKGCFLYAPEKGVFAVTFALNDEAQKIKYCKTNAACPECQECDVAKQVCVPISGCSVD